MHAMRLHIVPRTLHLYIIILVSQILHCAIWYVYTVPLNFRVHVRVCEKCLFDAISFFIYTQLHLNEKCVLQLVLQYQSNERMTDSNANRHD